MPTSRTSILRGPGSVKFGDVVIHDADGITAEVETATKEIPSSISGTLDVIKTDQTGRVAFTPCGQMTDAILAALFPHQTPAIGSSLCGTADTPVEIHSLAGTKVKFFNSFLSKVPELNLSPVATAFGRAEITALLALGKGITDPDSFYKVESTAYALGYPDPSALTGVKYTGTFGTMSIPDTKEGWKVAVELGTEIVDTDNDGSIDATLSSVTVRASCTPLGLTEAQILAALPTSLGKGASLRGSNDLVIAGRGGLTVSLKNARMVIGPIQWGNATLRAGEVGFIASRSFTNGVAGPLYTVAMTASED